MWSPTTLGLKTKTGFHILAAVLVLSVAALLPPTTQATENPHTLQQGPFQGISSDRVTGSPFVASDGCVLAYDMETLDGPDMEEFCSTNDGSIAGTDDVEGLFGRSRSFDEDNADSVRVSDTPTLSALSAITISVWIYPENLSDGGTDATSIQGVITKAAAPASGASALEYEILLDRRSAQRDVSFAVSDESSISNTEFSIDDLTEGDWNHLLAYWDGSSQVIYLDGTEKVRDESPVSSMNDLGDDFTVGGGGYAADREFVGRIDEVLILSRTPSDNEIGYLATYRNYSFFFDMDPVPAHTNGSTWVFARGLTMGAAVNDTATFNLTVLGWDSESILWTSTANGDIRVQFNFTLFPSTRYYLLVNGVQEDILTSDGNGSLAFTWTDWSTNTFEVTTSVGDPTVFESLLPVGLAIGVLFIVIGLYAYGRRKGKNLGTVLLFLGGIALIFTGFDYQTSIGDVEMALMIIGAGSAVMVMSAIEFASR